MGAEDVRMLMLVSVNLVGVAVSFATLRANVQSLMKRVDRLDTTLHNGLSEKVARIDEVTQRMADVPIRVAGIEARCAAYRAGHGND